MTISELRSKRNKLVDAMDAFLDTHTNENGVLSASDDATYKGMEAEVAQLTDSIHRMERREEIEAELDPALYIGRSASQVDEFIASVVDPVLARHPDAPQEAELRV